jgi:hypothetical protein
MLGNVTRTSSIGDQETDRSLGNEIDTGGPVVVRVPTMIRCDDNAGTNTDGGDSIYNPHYSIQTIVEVKINKICCCFFLYKLIFLAYSSKLSSTK